MPDPFLDCLKRNIGAMKGYGKKRVEEAALAYERIRDSHVASGVDVMTAGFEAFERVINDINLDIARKQAALRTNTSIMADADRRMEHAIAHVKTKGGLQDKLAAATRSFNENVKTVPDAPSLQSEEARLAGLYHGILTRKAPDTTVRRRFGRRPREQQMKDFVQEMHEGGSGNPDAKNAAKVVREVLTLSYTAMRERGVKVRPWGPNDTLPPNISANRLLRKKGKLSATFADDMRANIDWTTQQWPDGRRVLPHERDDFLKASYNAIITNGKETGLSLGEDLEKAFLREANDQRLWKFKDGASWQAIHDKYGEGDVFGTLLSTLTHAIREEAKARVYGPDPDRMVSTIAALAQSKVTSRAAKGDKAGLAALPVLNAELRRYHNESTLALRSNPANPNGLALGVGAAANMLSAAQLGSAIVANTMGDAINVMTITMAESRGMHTLIRTMAEYVRGQMPGNAYPTLMNAQRMGYTIDDLIYNDIQTTRMNIMTTVAPTWTKGWARFWTMAGGVPRHTNLFRNSVNTSFLIDMAHWRNSKLADTPVAVQNMMRDAGIDAADWERIRTDMAIIEPRPGVEAFDSIQSYVTMPKTLAEKMHRMQINEVNNMVLMPTNEASVRLRGTNRPETVPGAILSSSTMYLAQPLAAAFHMVRTIMNARMSKTRLVGTIATFGLGMLMTGALSIQMRAVINRRKLEDMTDPAFWARAATAGGVFSIWGGFVSSIAEEDAAGFFKQLGGPMAGALADFSIAGKETAFQMAGLSDDQDGLRHLAEAVERYIGPKPFYAAAVLNREVYERMKELFDPTGYQRSVATRINNARRRGQQYTPGWKPSDRPITDILTGR